MKNHIGIVIDVGQTCKKCTKYRELGMNWGDAGVYWCNEYDRVMNNPRYICKNFREVLGEIEG